MFEEMAHFHFFLVGIEASHVKAVQRKTPLGGLESKIHCQLELIGRVAKAVQGSDFDWKGWYRKTAERYEMPDVDVDRLVGEHTEMRKTHILLCIESLEKKTQSKATEMYELLSEMVHPKLWI